MIQVMLICNAGMSTGMLAKRIEQASQESMSVHAYGEAEYPDYLQGVDVVLVGPQIRHLIPEIEKLTKAPVRGILPHHYGMLDGKGVYEEIKKIIRED